MSRPGHRGEGGVRLPWPAVLGAVWACGALFFAAPSPVPPLLAVACVAGRCARFRVPNRSAVRWGLRVGLAALVVVAAGAFARGSGSGIAAARGAPEVLGALNGFGQACAAELAIACWIAAPPGPGIVTVLTAAAFLAGCDVPGAPHFPAAAAVAVLLAIAAARGWAREPVSSPPNVPPADPAGSAPCVGSGNASRAAVPGVLWAAMALGLGALALPVFEQVRDRQLLALSRPESGSLSGIVGFSTAPSLDRGGDFRARLGRVLRLEGTSGPLHLRGMAFDTYVAGQWLPALDDRALRPLPPKRLRSRVPSDALRRVRVSRLGRGAAETGLLFAPLECAGVEVAAAVVRLGTGPSGPLIVEGPAAGAVAEYAFFLPGIRPEARAPAGLFAEPPSEAERRRCLGLPRNLDPRVQSLARELGSAASPAERIDAIVRHLRRRHAYRPTTDPGPGDPVTSFLLGRRPGHCEYFASAAVLLLRGAGVPARYVTGYYAHEAAGPDALLVRERDAHAWAEAWIDGRGWVTVDATPDEGLPDRAGRPAPVWTLGAEWLEDQLAAALRHPAALPLGGLGLALLLLAAGNPLPRIPTGRLRFRPNRRGREGAPEPYASPAPELAALGLRFERLLVRHGLGCPSDLPWEEHLARLAAVPRQSALDLAHARAWAAGYAAVRFGTPDAGTLRRLEAELADLESGRRASAAPQSPRRPSETPSQ